MSGDNIAYAAAMALALILPVAAIRSRQIGVGSGVKMAVLWVCLFALVAMGFSWLGL